MFNYLYHVQAPSLNMGLILPNVPSDTQHPPKRHAIPELTIHQLYTQTSRGLSIRADISGANHKNKAQKPWCHRHQGAACDVRIPTDSTYAGGIRADG